MTTNIEFELVEATNDDLSTTQMNPHLLNCKSRVRTSQYNFFIWCLLVQSGSLWSLKHILGNSITLSLLCSNLLQIVFCFQCCHASCTSENNFCVDQYHIKILIWQRREDNVSVVNNVNIVISIGRAQLDLSMSSIGFNALLKKMDLTLY